MFYVFLLAACVFLSDTVELDSNTEYKKHCFDTMVHTFIELIIALYPESWDFPLLLDVKGIHKTTAAQN